MFQETNRIRSTLHTQKLELWKHASSTTQCCKWFLRWAKDKNDKQNRQKY